MAHFKKSSQTSQEIPTASMPDIIFILLIFFMTTTVMRTETIEVRTVLPQAEALEKIEQKRLVSFVYVGPRKMGGNQVGEMAVQIDDALITELTNIRTIMYNKLMENPKLIVSLRVDEDAQMGYVTDVQQEFREAGTLRINYSTKRQYVQ